MSEESFDEELDALARRIEARIAYQQELLDELPSVEPPAQPESSRFGLRMNMT